MAVRAIVTLCCAAASVAAQRPIDQIEHIVVFMQENRAYVIQARLVYKVARNMWCGRSFGCTQARATGVRPLLWHGFNDRAQVVLPSGLPSLFQPSDQKDPGKDYILPFPAWTLNTSATCMDAPTMAYYTDLAMYHDGRVDAWNTARAPGMGMSYMTRADLPYYYTLYDSFTAGDQYHQSTFTCTNPNRMHLFTGSNGLSVGLPPVIDNTEPPSPHGYTWTTMGEVLEAAGVSWRVYQQQDNFDDNGFAYFQKYMEAKPGNPLFDKGMARVDDLIAEFDKDMAAGTLPQVSWIVGPANVSEHASWWPSAGEDFTARILARLEAHPEVYAKTAFILNYDEGGQFFDHAAPPTPPLSAASGVSTVSTKGEVSDLGLPVGMGFRVPLLVISPWSRGHAVVSEVFDHTSVNRLIETRFNVTCPTISPWRRAMTGDLTSAFDFTTFDASWPTLPDTSGYVARAADECHNMPAPHIPATQTYPVQESGTRLSRPLPYEFVVSDSVTAEGLALSLSNTGLAGAPFHIYDVPNLKAVAPRVYAVGAGTVLADTLPLQAATYLFALHGPNGFVRTFAGDVSAAGGLSLRLSASATYDASKAALTVKLGNKDALVAAVYECVDNAYGAAAQTGSVSPTGEVDIAFAIGAVTQGNWYDVTCSLAATKGGAVVFERRFMGRWETGVATISDPAMAAGKPGFAHDHAARLGLLGTSRTPGSLTAQVLAQMAHPDLPEVYQHIARAAVHEVGTQKDALWMHEL